MALFDFEYDIIDSKGGDTMLEIAGKRYYEVKEVAEKLGTTARTIRARIKAGILEAKKLGRAYIVSEEAITNMLERE